MLLRTSPPRPISRRRALAWLTAGIVSLAVKRSFAAQTFTFGTDLQGQPVHNLASPQTQCTVALFVATDCPISNRYLPEIARLSQQFTARGVHFWLVYPNPADDIATVRAHQTAYPAVAAMSQLLTPNPDFLYRAHVHVTPEAAIFAAGSAATQPALWHGRIDDRYLSFGKQRPAATRHDLADAIDAVLAGQQPARPPAPPVGCAIMPRT